MRKIIGKDGTYPIYNDYGEGVIVKKIQDEKRRVAYEICIPKRPKIFGVGKTRCEIRYANTVREYAQASANLIRDKKAAGRWY